MEDMRIIPRITAEAEDNIATSWSSSDVASVLTRVTAGNEVELLTLLFFSVTILEITLLAELCQSHPSSVISVVGLVTSVAIITSHLF